MCMSLPEHPEDFANVEILKHFREARNPTSWFLRKQSDSCFFSEHRPQKNVKNTHFQRNLQDQQEIMQENVLRSVSGGQLCPDLIGWEMLEEDLLSPSHYLWNTLGL